MTSYGAPAPPPFELAEQLNNEFIAKLEKTNASAQQTNVLPVTAHQTNALSITAFTEITTAAGTIPDHPLISVDDTTAVQKLLSDTVLTPRIEALSRIGVLFFVATPASDNIWALHAQAVNHRRIILTDDPELHLTWYYDHIFIKPIPAFLYSHAFWTVYLSNATGDPNLPGDPNVRKSALGFVRTWAYLVRSRTDFDIATEAKLIRFTPLNNGTQQNDGTKFTYEDFVRFMKFINRFGKLRNPEVSVRYHWGELRLSRLNLWTRFTFTSFHYHKTYGQYFTYLSRLTTPFLFVFATVSVTLAAMQVELAVEALGGWNDWGKSFQGLSRWFSVMSLVLIAVAIVFLMGLVVLLLGRELWFAVVHRRRPP